MNRSALIVAVSGLALLTAAPSGLAQTATRTAAPQVPASVVAGEGVQLDEVTVYGTLDERPAFTYPGMVTVIGRDAIETTQPSSVYDVIRNVPGVDVPGGPRRNGQNPSIRGLGGQRTQILVDGARQSFQSAHDGRFFLDPELLRSVEVIRGPVSALYGSGALGGVIALRTQSARDLLQPGETMGVRVRIGGQSVNREMLTSLTGFGAAGGWDIVGNVTRRYSGNIRLGGGAGELQADDDIVSGMARVQFDQTNFGFTAQAIRYRGESREPDNPQGLTTASATTPLVDKDIRADLYSGELRIHPEGMGWLDARIIPYYNRTRIGERYVTTGRFVDREVETSGITAYNHTRFELNPGLNGLVTVGVDAYRNSYSGFDSSSTTGTRDGVPNAESTYFGAFTQLELRAPRPLGLPGELTLLPGLRYDTFTTSATGQGDNRNEAVSPRLGVTYQPLPWLLGFVSYGQAFRAPGVEELYLGGTHFTLPHYARNTIFASIPAFSFLRTATISNVFVPNPNLRPELGTSVEGGLGVNLTNVLFQGDRFRAKASIFRMEVEDYINLSVNVPAPQATCFFPPFFPCSAGTTTSANIINARLQGVEFEAAYTSRYFDIAFAYAGITGHDTVTGSYLGGLSPDRFFADAAVKFEDLNLRVGARTMIATDFRRTNTTSEYRSGYELLDLYMVWEPRLFGLSGIRIDLGVDNVFDRRYERTFAGVTEPGRNYRGALSYRIAF
jgi:hemoglobin/transferrin/lactoferrin receptor protein